MNHKLLLKFLKIPTKSINSNGLANIAGIEEGVAFIQKELKDLPLEWTKIQKNQAAPFYYAKSKVQDKAKPKILLSSHIDTVYSAEDITVKETEDKIFGSGAQDMKGSIWVIVEVLKQLHAINKLENITFYISPQEEIAVPDYREEIQTLALNSDYALVYESTLDSFPKNSNDFRSIVTSRRGLAMFELEITSPGGHSGILSKKVDRFNSILKMSEVIAKLEKLADYKKETTVNIGVISGGKAINVIAPSCKIHFETRFRELAEYYRVEEAIRELVNKEILAPYTYELNVGIFFPALNSNKSEEGFIKLCKEVGSDLNLQIIEEQRAGGSEANLIKYYNLKCAVLDGFGLRGDGQHSLNEFIFKDSIGQSIEFSRRILLKLLS